MTKKNIEKAFVKYVKEYQDTNGDQPLIFQQPPTPLEFLQKCVYPNRPAVIKGAFDHWPANSKWTDDYLCNTLGDQQVTVAVTPNGLADAVTYDPITEKEYFVMPHEEKMTFPAFLQRLHSPSSSSSTTAYYISLQNGSLPLEYSKLEKDIDAEVLWCSEALGLKPDAVNFWFGDHKSVTSLHKDPYENCYAVVRGQKTFVLLPPSEYVCLHESIYPSAVYTPTYSKDHQHQQGGSTDEDTTFEITPLEGIEVPWIPVDPMQPDLNRFPRFRYAKPMVITVNQGEMLYLPSLWFHQVYQHGDDGVIAVNYWYDMNYQQSLFPFMNLSRRLIAEIIDGQSTLDIDVDDEVSDDGSIKEH